MRPAHHHDAFQRWAAGGCGVGDVLGAHQRPAPRKRVAGNQRLGADIVQPVLDGRRPVARRTSGTATSPACAQAISTTTVSGTIGRWIPTASPWCKPERAQPGAAVRHLHRQLPVVEESDRALLAFPDDGCAVRADVAVDAAVGDVEPGPRAPHRPLDAARDIDDPVVVLLEVDAEKAQDLFGEPADVGDRALIKLVEIRGPV